MTTFLVYEPEANVARAEWAARQCIGPKDTLHSVVPTGFEKYVRLCQPGWFSPGFDLVNKGGSRVDFYTAKKVLKPIRWCDIAQENGKVVHSLMQWYSIASPDADIRSGVAGTHAPFEGVITREMVETLFDVLVSHSGENQECICAFWEGFGNLHNPRLSTRVEGIGQQGHFLFHAPLAAIRDQWLLVLDHSKEPYGLTPQAVWPLTHDWYFAVPFELRSAFLGGSTTVTTKIQNEQRLESYEVFPGDNIWRDEIN